MGIQSQLDGTEKSQYLESLVMIVGRIRSRSGAFFVPHCQISWEAALRAAVLLGPLMWMFACLALGQESQLPARIREFVAKNYPELSPSTSALVFSEEFWKMSPSCHPNTVRGDFDDDGRTDWAVLLESAAYPPRRAVLVTFLRRSGEDFSPVEVAEGSGEYLCSIRKGRKIRSYESDGDRLLEAKSDVVMLAMDSSADCFFINESQVVKIHCAD